MLTAGQRKTHTELGIPDDYGADGTPPYYREAKDLVDIGPNLVGRMQRLTPETAARWSTMVNAARSDGVTLLIVSGFRGFDYQAQLIRQKLDNGQAIAEILKVNAAPGFSQHHSGTAIDIATPGSRPLTEDFETTPAFDWLTANADEHGFLMTYPRGNAHGFVYEPWHWALDGLITD